MIEFFSKIQMLECNSIVYWTYVYGHTEMYCMESIEMLIDPAVCVFVTGAARRVEERQRVKLS